MNEYIINLDNDFNPKLLLNSIHYNIIEFSGGELHIKLDNNMDYSVIDKVIITNRVRNGNDIIKILIAKDALERKGINNFDLIIPYIPYARQDRQCFDGESFTLKVFTNLINSQNFNNVIVLDAHSDVSPALIDNCVNIKPNDFINMAIYDIKDIDTSDIILISPDSGANKKCNKLFEELKCFKNIVKCDKKRNVEDGSLSNFEIFADDLKGEACLIVDDICDGGRTFLGIYDALKEKNAGNVYLYATHGIFSNGTDKLSECFKKIYTTNSFKDIDARNNKIIQFKILL